jgi:hypothetical protein
MNDPRQENEKGRAEDPKPALHPDLYLQDPKGVIQDTPVSHSGQLPSSCGDGAEISRHEILMKLSF